MKGCRLSSWLDEWLHEWLLDQDRLNCDQASLGDEGPKGMIEEELICAWGLGTHT